MGKLALLVLAGSLEAYAQCASPPRLNYAKYVGGSVLGLAVDSAGNAYVPGGTPDCKIAKVNPSGSVVSCLAFPLLETVGLVGLDPSGYIYAVSAPASPGTARYAVVIKLSPDGRQSLYRTFIDGVRALGLAVDPAGRLYLTGSAVKGFTSTSCLLQRPAQPCVTGPFAARLSASGNVEYETYLRDGGYGSAIAVDSRGEAWVAGPGFVMKVDADGGSVLVSRFFGSGVAAGIAVDSKDSVYVVGSASGDVPTTPGTLQPRLPSGRTGNAGFVVKLEPTGDVVYGTYLDQGSSIHSVAVDSDGNAYFGLNGVAAPPGRPMFCGPGIWTLITVLNADGSTILASAHLNNTPVEFIALEGHGGVYATMPPGAIAKFDLTTAASGLELACVANAADAYEPDLNLPVVAPGEIVTLGGKGFTAATSVMFNGRHAPVLYADSSQINAVVPFEIGGPEAQLTLNNGQETLTWPALVLPANPAIFTDAILNEDGTVNTSVSPAPVGSIVSMYISGAGLMTPPIADGASGPLQAPYPTPILKVSATFGAAYGPAPLLFASQAPGLIAGLVLVRLQIPETIRSGTALLRVYVGITPSLAEVRVYIQ